MYIFHRKYLCTRIRWIHDKWTVTRILTKWVCILHLIRITAHCSSIDTHRFPIESERVCRLCSSQMTTLDSAWLAGSDRIALRWSLESYLHSRYARMDSWWGTKFVKYDPKLLFLQIHHTNNRMSLSESVTRCALLSRITSNARVSSLVMEVSLSSLFSPWLSFLKTLVETHWNASKTMQPDLRSPTYTFTSAVTHAYIHTYVHTYTHTYTCLYIYVCTSVCTDSTCIRKHVAHTDSSFALAEYTDTYTQCVRTHRVECAFQALSQLWRLASSTPLHLGPLHASMTTSTHTNSANTGLQALIIRVWSSLPCKYLELGK
jgi:hypothetical protein